jgi:hypothetical protein
VAEGCDTREIKRAALPEEEGAASWTLVHGRFASTVSRSSTTTFGASSSEGHAKRSRLSPTRPSRSVWRRPPGPGVSCAAVVRCRHVGETAVFLSKHRGRSGPISRVGPSEMDKRVVQSFEQVSLLSTQRAAFRLRWRAGRTTDFSGWTASAGMGETGRDGRSPAARQSHHASDRRPSGGLGRRGRAGGGACLCGVTAALAARGCTHRRRAGHRHRPAGRVDDPRCLALHAHAFAVNQFPIQRERGGIDRRARLAQPAQLAWIVGRELAADSPARTRAHRRCGAGMEGKISHLRLSPPSEPGMQTDFTARRSRRCRDRQGPLRTEMYRRAGHRLLRGLGLRDRPSPPHPAARLRRSIADQFAFGRAVVTQGVGSVRTVDGSWRGRPGRGRGRVAARGAR